LNTRRFELSTIEVACTQFWKFAPQEGGHQAISNQAGEPKGALGATRLNRVRSLHQKLHVAANPRDVPTEGPGRDPQYAAELQRLPDGPSRCDPPERGWKRELQQMRWGLVPFWWTKPLKELRLATFNARVETVETKPFFREPFKQRRCLMPVSGYFEWQDTPAGKQLWYFTARDGSPVLTVAGLWDQWKNKETGERIKSCAMIIAAPNEFVAEVHDRMPVLLMPEQFDHWLSGDMGVDELKPAPNDYLQRWAVSKRVNSSKADKDDANLIEPVKLAA
jgi:putative SOS response-associated peptidase YedK